MVTTDRKLKSNSGAVLVLALFFLLFCGVVGALTVTAASTNAGRMANAKDEVENYLAVRSAANFLLSELDNCTYTGQFDMKYTFDGVPGASPRKSYCFPDSALTGRFDASPFILDFLPSTALTGLYIRTASYHGFKVSDKVSSGSSDRDGHPMPPSFLPLPPGGVMTEFTFEVPNANVPEVKATLTFSTDPDSLMMATLTVESADGSYKMSWTSRPTLHQTVSSQPTVWLTNQNPYRLTEQITTVSNIYRWEVWNIVS